MTNSVERTGECPSSGQTLASADESCPQSGKEITISPKKPGKTKGTPSKATKVGCPHCGEMVSKRSKKCPACRTSLPAGFYKVSAKSVDKETSEPKTEIVPQAVQAAVEGTGQSLSSNSQVVLERTEPESQRCEAPLEGGMKVTETMVAVDSPPVKEPPETVEGQGESADLAAPLESILVKESSGAVKDVVRPAEPIAHADSQPVEGSSGTSADAMSPPEPIVSVDPVHVEESPRTLGDEMKTAGEITLVDSVSAERMSELIEDDRKAAEIGAPVNSAPAKESPEIVSLAEVVGSRSCPECEAIVPMSSLEDSVRIETLIEIASHLEQAELAAIPPKAQPKEESSAPVDKTETKPARPIRKRKLKSAKCVPIPTVNNSMS